VIRNGNAITAENFLRVGDYLIAEFRIDPAPGHYACILDFFFLREHNLLLLLSFSAGE
jgi:hypothetical protein